MRRLRTLIDDFNVTPLAPGVHTLGGIKSKEIVNAFGIVLGGPIVKNKQALHVLQLLPISRPEWRGPQSPDRSHARHLG